MNSTPLTPAQRAVLEAACDDPSGQIVLPQNLKGTARHKVVHSLLKRELIAQWQPARTDAVRASVPMFAQYVISPFGRATIAELAVSASDLDRSDGEPTSFGRPLQALGGGPVITSIRAPLTVFLAQAKARSPSKVQAVRNLLASPEGATLDQLVARTGWKPHTVRAALSRLRQSGLDLERAQREDGSSFYRVAAVGAGEGHL
jgi:hypothetical protein